MDDENLQSRIIRLSHGELVKILVDAADDNPGVKDHIAAAMETPEPHGVQSGHEQNEFASTTSTVPPPYSSTMSLSNRLRRSSLIYLPIYHLSRPAHVPNKRPCICINCKQMFWSHEESRPVDDCIGHPGTLEKLHKVIPDRRKRRLVEARYLDVGSGDYKCWTCCLQKKSAAGCSAFEHHVAAA